MKISRVGASKNYGESLVLDQLPHISWSSTSKLIILKFYGVESIDSKHNYTVSLSIEEFSKIVECLSIDAIKNDSQKLYRDLGDYSRSFSRLAFVANGASIVS